MKKLLAIITVLAMSISSLFIGGCDFLSGSDSKNQEVSYVSLTINPEVEFTVSEDNVILSVNPINEDAEILLSDIDLSGVTIDEAAETFVELATESGYINSESEDNEVTVDIITESGEEEIESCIKQKINKFFEDNKITGVVKRESLKEYKAEADALGISVQKLKLINRAIEINPELTVDYLKDLKLSEIVHLLKGQYSFGILKDEFFAAKALIKANYAEMFTLEEEIDALKNQLENFTGTDEEKTVLENSKDEKEAAFELLKTAYEEEIEALKEEYEARYEALKETFKQTKNALKNKAEKFNNEELAALKTQYQAAKALIETNYANMFSLETEIEALEAQIELLLESDETLAGLQITLTEKTEAYKILKAAYDVELEALKTAYEESVCALKSTYETAKEAIKSQLREQIETAKQQYRNEDTQKRQGKN